MNEWTCDMLFDVLLSAFRVSKLSLPLYFFFCVSVFFRRVIVGWFVFFEI